MLEDDARDLLLLAATVLADRACWTTKAMRARRWRRRVGDHAKSCADPKDPRASEWSVLGALDLVADEEEARAVIVALDLLLRVARGWSISRVEDEGHEWMLWLLASALVLPADHPLDPRRPVDRAVVDHKPRSRESEATVGPSTVRSSQRRQARAA